MRKKQGDKENAILNSAVKIFAEQGFHKAKIQNIAENAKVATGSVYVYYKSKDAILDTIFERLWRKLYSELKLVVNRTDINPVEKFDEMIDLLFDIFIEDSSLAIVFVNEQQNIPQNNGKEFTNYYFGFQDLGEQIVREGIEQNLFNPDIDVKIVRSFIFGGLRQLLRTWAHNPQEAALNQIRKNIKHITKRGLMQ